MSAPNNCAPPDLGHTDYPSLDINVLLILIRRLGDVVGSKETAAAEIHTRYQGRIAELEEENKMLVQYANDALLVREAVNNLNFAIYGEPNSNDNPYSIAEDPDLSPILEQRVLNLQATLERVRQRARKKEEGDYKKIMKLEGLAHMNFEQIVGALRRNIETPILCEPRGKTEDEQTTILRGSKATGGNLVSRWN